MRLRNGARQPHLRTGPDTQQASPAGRPSVSPAPPPRPKGGPCRRLTFVPPTPLALALRPSLPTSQALAPRSPAHRENGTGGVLPRRPPDPWEGQRAVLTSSSFSAPSRPTPPKKDSGLTAWPAPGGHSRGPGQQPAASPPGAEQAAGWFGGSGARCRGRRSSPGGAGQGWVPGPSAPSPPPTFAFRPILLSPSGLGSAMPLPPGSLLDFPREETRLLWDSVELYSSLVRHLFTGSAWLGACLASGRSRVCLAWNPRGQRCGGHAVGAQEVIHKRAAAAFHGLPCPPRPRPPGLTALRRLPPSQEALRRSPTSPSPIWGPETYGPGDVLWGSTRGEGAGAADGRKAPPNQDRQPHAQPPGERQGPAGATHLLPGWVVGSTDDTPQPADVAAEQGDDEA